MGRYLTRRYVVMNWDEATRLASLDQTPLEAIRYAATAELLHRTEWWAWWSDELLTTAIGLPESVTSQALSADAVELISDIWASDSPQPECGWAMLAQVQRILNREVLSISMLNDVQPAMRERLTVEFAESQPGALYCFWVWLGDDNGYLCEITTELPEIFDIAR
jgi:hypothetical protein